MDAKTGISLARLRFQARERARARLRDALLLSDEYISIEERRAATTAVRKAAPVVALPRETIGTLPRNLSDQQQVFRPGTGRTLIHAAPTLAPFRAPNRQAMAEHRPVRAGYLSPVVVSHAEDDFADE
jgi:hypothetical protein